MTTLSNDQVLAELGWTTQIIHDLLGGRVPKYWRPPYGDVDNRVRAIASGVFGLETVPWNQGEPRHSQRYMMLNANCGWADSGDWAIGNDPQYTNQSVQAQMKTWLTGTKSPGLLILEHETNPNTVGNFIASYPLMVSNDWKVESVAGAFGMPFYQNALDSTGAVTNMSVGDSAPNLTASASGSSSMSTSMTSSSGSASASASSTALAIASGTGVVRVAASALASQSGAAGHKVVLRGGLASVAGAMMVVVGTMFTVLL